MDGASAPDGRLRAPAFPTERIPRAKALADRHYNRQNPESAQFVPPGACVVLIEEQEHAVWVSSWPQAEFVQHAWAGAWVNSLFRSENAGRASDLILSAVAATRSIWPEPPELGLISFVDPEEVPPVMRRSKPIFGYCYLAAGFEHVGFTKAGLWAWQLRPERMPPALAPRRAQMALELG